MSYGAHMSESCHTHRQRVLIAGSEQMSHVAYINMSHENESWHTHEWVMPHTWVSHVTHTDTERSVQVASKWVMSHTYIWVMKMSYGTHMSESYRTHRQVVLIIGTGWRRPIGCLIYVGHFPQKSPVMTCSFAKIDLQLEASNGSSPPCCEEMMHVASVYELWKWVWAHTWMGHAAHMSESCHTHRHRVLTGGSEQMRHVTHTHMNDLCHTHRHRVLNARTGWQRPIGCLKLQVFFCKRATDYVALLRKVTCEDKASNESSPPSSEQMSHMKHI